MIPGQVFLVILVAGLVGWLLYLQAVKRRERREALARMAAELGWSFDPSRDGDFHRTYSQFSAFTTGDSRAAYNTLRGPYEIGGRQYRCVMGDYTYSTGSGKNRQTHYISYLIVQLPFVGVPDLLVRHENLLDRFAQALGFPDINFESAEFSRKFVVKSHDKKFAYDVIHQRMMQFLLTVPPPTIELRQGHCLLRVGLGTWQPLQFNQRLGWAREFFGLWPDFLIQQLHPIRGTDGAPS
jgi:hypothetical protein